MPRGKTAATPVGTDVAAFPDAGSIPAASTIASFADKDGGNAWSVGLAGLLHDSGVFDLLLPATVEGDLCQWLKELNKWLFKEFCGDLQINVVWVKLTAADFYDFGPVSQQVASALEQSKSQLAADLIWAWNEAAQALRGHATIDFCGLSCSVAIVSEERAKEIVKA